MVQGCRFEPDDRTAQEQTEVEVIHLEEVGYDGAKLHSFPEP